MSSESYDIVYETVQGRTSSVKIKNGKVVMRLSRYARGAERDRIVAKFRKWAERRLINAQTDSFVMPEYKDGGHVNTHNKVYEIAVIEEDRKTVSCKLVDGFLIEVRKSVGKEIDLKELVEKTIIRDQDGYLNEVIDELNEMHFQEKLNACRYKRTQGRFGSCSSKRNINISFRLLLAPREVFRYVCVHELAHLKEMNHSRRFWALVEEAMPEYREHEKWLRNHGFLLG